MKSYPKSAEDVYKKYDYVTFEKCPLSNLMQITNLINQSITNKYSLFNNQYLLQMHRSIKIVSSII